MTGYLEANPDSIGVSAERVKMSRNISDMHFDVVHACDPRYAGGSSSAIRAELMAARRFGLRTAILPFLGPHGRLNGPFENRIYNLIEAYDIAWLSADSNVTCDILFAHHPMVFQNMPHLPVRLKPRRVICVAHHPLFDGRNLRQYDPMKVASVLESMFDVTPIFAPVGPRVRSQLEGSTAALPVLRRDLSNMLHLPEWRRRIRPAPRQTAVLGRHSRPSALKWPDTIQDLQAAYPEDKNFTIRVLGELPSKFESESGRNWQILPFGTVDVPTFLESLDFYVYYHSKEWIEAFGIGVAESMAVGLVTVLDPAFEPLFEDGAVYASVSQAGDLIHRILDAPNEYQQQSDRARTLVERKFSTDTYPDRMTELYDDLGLLPVRTLKQRMSAAARISAAGSVRKAPLMTPKHSKPQSRRRVLFVATNGIGLGHITRLMAIAERMSPDLEAVFFTRSAGSALIFARGHAGDYIPSGMKLGVTDASWNRVYSHELLAAIEAFSPACVVFDGNYPFPGLLEVAATRADLAWVWIRRALWRTHHRFDPTMQDQFDLVIEPGELAMDEDNGPTTRSRQRSACVSPILLIDPSERKTRIEAAVDLNIDPSRKTVAVQLGSRQNFEYDELHKAIVDELLRRGLQIVEVQNPLASPIDHRIEGVEYRSVYPLTPSFSAFDLFITNSGYNSFHEAVYGVVPTIFVPNEADEMDDQHLRAAYASASGLSLTLRTADLGQVVETIDTALSENFKSDLRRRSLQRPFNNGAFQAARYIEQLIFSVRTDRPLHAAIARA